jgi:hypothetical protein
VQSKPTVADDNGMTGIGATVIPDHDVAVFGKDVYDLALALVAPLQSHDTTIHFVHFPHASYENESPKGTTEKNRNGLPTQPLRRADQILDCMAAVFK